MPPGDDAGQDASRDAGAVADGALADSGHDAGVDAGTDAEAETDVGSDTGVDCCTADSGPDADAGPDGGLDAGTDAGSIRFFVSSYLGSDTSDGSESSPFKTVKRARDAVRDLKDQGRFTSAVHVFLREGRYELIDQQEVGEEFTFTHIDSGTADKPITYKAYGNDPVTLSGGKTISKLNWTVHSQLGIYKTVLDSSQIPAAVLNAGFRSLYVNGRRAVRARSPNQGSYYYHDTPGIASYYVWSPICGDPNCPEQQLHNPTENELYYRGTEFDPAWSSLDETEVVRYKAWMQNRQTVVAIDSATKKVTFNNPIDASLHFGEGRYYLENRLEFLDLPGEWFYDKGGRTLYYKPLAGEAIESSEITVPLFENLLAFRGTAENPVEHINWQGVDFAFTDWAVSDRTSNGTLEGHQGGYYLETKDAVILRHASSVAFISCRFTMLGGFAVSMDQRCSNTKFLKNEFSYLGGGAMRIAQGQEFYGSYADTGTLENSISENIIHDTGEVFAETAVISVGDAARIRIDHNHIYNAPYSAISLGWHWDFVDYGVGQIIVEYNLIEDVMQKLIDGGAVYTLGKQIGTVIRNNIIRNVIPTVHHALDPRLQAIVDHWLPQPVLVYNDFQQNLFGIYLDEGSNGILVENNLVYLTGSASINLHYMGNNLVKNNIFVDPMFNNYNLDLPDSYNPFKYAFLNDENQKQVPYQYNPTLSICPYGVTVERNIFFGRTGNVEAGRTHVYYQHKNNVCPDSPIEAAGSNIFYYPGFDAERVAAKLTGDFSTPDTLFEYGWTLDTTSLNADPQFLDPASNDFRLSPGSPALSKGFVAIDYSQVGPRP
ncbi:MAG: right-handed parallel beta-helix repeat-containing protein [Myxococcota bacterium]